jgi:PAS domain-containing protein
LAPDDRRDELASIFDMLKQGKSIPHLETVRRAKDGRFIDVALTISPTRDEAGHVTGASTIARDITDRKRADQERGLMAAQIENERQRLNNVVANVPGVVWEAWGEPDQASQRINFVSEYVEKMLGYRTDEWLSTPNFWLSIVHPDDAERAAQEAAAISLRVRVARAVSDGWQRTGARFGSRRSRLLYVTIPKLQSECAASLWTLPYVNARRRSALFG